MRIKSFKVSTYELPLTIGGTRRGALVKLEDFEGVYGCGDLAPLPQRSREGLYDAIKQLEYKRSELLSIDWTPDTFLEKLSDLNLFPSAAFALESALFAILSPVPSCSIEVSALLTGASVQEIIKVAQLRKLEGYTSAKLKIGNLSFDEAFIVIKELKGCFRLRIDVNSAWKTKDVLRFFSQFSQDSFDYVEDPLPNLTNINDFFHPIAIEKPFSKGVSLSQLETVSMLKAIIYKPTVLGGILTGKFYQKWAKDRNISVILSSSFESDVGHFHLAATAFRLGLELPIGIGTYHYLDNYLLAERLQFSEGRIHLRNKV